ncbi:hypothetical protein RGC32_00525 [Helicobacter pylori]|uniref:hypothetical protein n=1 Tax=Helicobacter pylori TaxID=210 RepID=UPI0029285B3F|nr:hypothetical protein [Helicobacter pylori]MDU9810376.1 hypothetical protein [Helicobacter pylori]
MKNFIYQQSANYFNTWAFVYVLRNSHNYISSYPKPSITLKKIFPIVFNCHVIYCSATPCAESYSKLFHQLFLCRYSPFSHHKFKSFYQWHRVFGITSQRHINGLLVNDYSKTKEALVLATIEPSVFNYANPNNGRGMFKIVVSNMYQNNELHNKILQDEADAYMIQKEVNALKLQVMRLKKEIVQLKQAKFTPK